MVQWPEGGRVVSFANASAAMDASQRQGTARLVPRQATAKNLAKRSTAQSAVRCGATYY